MLKSKARIFIIYNVRYISVSVRMITDSWPVRCIICSYTYVCIEKSEITLAYCFESIELARTKFFFCKDIMSDPKLWPIRDLYISNRFYSDPSRVKIFFVKILMILYCVRVYFELIVHMQAYIVFQIILYDCPLGQNENLYFAFSTMDLTKRLYHVKVTLNKSFLRF